MGKILISEEEKERILGMHKDATKKHYLSEQNTQPDNVSGLKIPISRTFGSGKYLIKNEAELDPYVTQIQNFLKGKENQKVSIVVSAGESQVPNRDGEIGGTNPPVMKQGELAQKRMDSVETVVKNKFGNLPNVTITKTQPKIGTTTWDPNKDNKDDVKYTKEQFVNIIVRPQGTTPEPEKTDPPCNQYDFYFGNAVYRTLDKVKAKSFLNVLRDNPQGTELTPNCVNFVGNTYKTVPPTLRNKFYSHFKDTKGMVGNADKIYTSQEEYNKDPNKVWIDPIKTYGMVSV
jgi:hypothetical protein